MTLGDLYETYEMKLRNYAVGLTRDAQRADDLVQETFIRAMGHLALLDHLKPYQRRAWLHRTLKNLFLDEEQARRRREALAERLTRGASAGYFMKEVVYPSPFELVPERFRDLVEKRYVQGMTSREIAEELGIPAQTVRSRLHLALKDLRSHQAKFR